MIQVPMLKYKSNLQMSPNIMKLHICAPGTHTQIYVNIMSPDAWYLYSSSHHPIYHNFPPIETETAQSIYHNA